MDKEITKKKENAFYSEHLRNYHNNLSKENNMKIPLRSKLFQNRLMSENEWNQEYYIIYNSYLLEEKDL